MSEEEYSIEFLFQIIYSQTSNISSTLVDNSIVDHLDVGGPTTFSFST